MLSLLLHNGKMCCARHIINVWLLVSGGNSSFTSHHSQDR